MRANDADNSLRLAIGNEASQRDIERFARRFGTEVRDFFSSTEGGVSVQRTVDTPPGSIGRAVPGVEIRDVLTDEPCEPAVFDAHGRMLNPERAIGEMVNTMGPRAFRGYYNNDEADEARMRGGVYRSGDLAYVDGDGFYYFAGRTADWLRVDGENLSAGLIEASLMAHPDVVQAAVYAVPAVDVGDEVMAALVIQPGTAVDPAVLHELIVANPELSPKAMPRYVRITEALPQTPTHKVVKSELIAEAWNCDDPVFWRRARQPEYVILSSEDKGSLNSQEPSLPG